MGAKIECLEGSGKSRAVIIGENAGEKAGRSGEWVFIIFRETILLCAI
jgi:hypothetical protein